MDFVGYNSRGIEIMNIEILSLKNWNTCLNYICNKWLNNVTDNITRCIDSSMS